MCLTWTFAAGKETPNFLEVIRDVLQINMQRYYECSARYISFKSSSTSIRLVSILPTQFLLFSCSFFMLHLI